MPPAPSDGERLFTLEKGVALAPQEVEVPITPRSLTNHKPARPPGKWIAQEVRAFPSDHDPRRTNPDDHARSLLRGAVGRELIEPESALR